MVTSRIVLVLLCSSLSHAASLAKTTAGECPTWTFKCDGMKCIPKEFMCNNEIDCEDKSDELNCDGAVVQCNQPGVFDCGNGHCIAMDSVCDGKPDCPDGQDEPRGQCGVNECLLNNGNCSQTCVDTLTSFHCTCLEGYTLWSDGATCEVNECLLNNGNCSQTCVDTLTSYYCACQEGYKLGSDNRTCDATTARTERTLVIISLDGFLKGLGDDQMVGNFTNFLLSSKTLKFVSSKIVWTTDKLIKYYPEMPSKPFLVGLVNNVSPKPVLLITVYEGIDVVSTLRSMLPHKTGSGAIREDMQNGKNTPIIYCSESVASAEQEINLWF